MFKEKNNVKDKTSLRFTQYSKLYLPIEVFLKTRPFLNTNLLNQFQTISSLFQDQIAVVQGNL